MSERSIRVLVTDPVPLLLSALATALAQEPDMQVVAATTDTDAALAGIEQAGPDVAVLASGLSPLNGVRACAAVKAAGSPTKVLIVHEYADQNMLLAAVEAGADGFASREGTYRDLVDAIRRLERGEACIPPPMLGVLLRDLIERRRAETAVLERLSRLSKRERQVFALMVEGHDHREIADLLVLSPHTSRTHIQNVLVKLGVHSRLEAAALAISYDLLARMEAGS